MARNLCIFLLLFVIVSHINSQHIELGISPTPPTQRDEIKEKKEEEKKKDEFISMVAAKFEYDDEELQNLRREGFGRFELIKLILISTYTGTNFEEVIKLRKSGNKLSQIAKKYNLSYKEIHVNARKIKKELEEVSDDK